MMKNMKYILVIVISLWCVANGQSALKAIAVIKGAVVSGNVTFTQKSCESPVFVEVDIVGLTQGAHGFHIHEKGDLSGGCLSTLGHYNPDKVSLYCWSYITLDN